MTIRTVSLLTMSLIWASASIADDSCPWYSKLVGGCDIGKGLTDVSKSLPSLGMKDVNYWGYLLEKYHAGTQGNTPLMRMLAVVS